MVTRALRRLRPALAIGTSAAVATAVMYGIMELRATARAWPISASKQQPQQPSLPLGFLRFIVTIWRRKVSQADLERGTLKFNAYHFVWLLWILLVRWPSATVLEFLKVFWRPRKDVSKDIVLVTGGGSGIGRGLAHEFARQGSAIVLWDINTEAMAAVADEIRTKYSAVVHHYQVNLADKDEIYAAAEVVRSEVGDVSILINNAGIVTGKSLLDAPDGLMELTMKVNAMAHFWTLKAFLPAMITNKHGHVVSIASSAGHNGVPGLGDYCASKFAAVGLNESLRLQLRKDGSDGVHTTVVCPYFIDTGMFKGIRAKHPLLMPMLTPKYAIQKIVDAVQTNQAQLLMPRMLNLNSLVRGVMPVAVFDETQEWMVANDAMDDFIGRVRQK